MLNLLLIDDNEDDRVLIIYELRREFPELQVEPVIDTESLHQALTTGNFNLVITDYQLRWNDGLTVLRDIKTRYPSCPVIMFTDSGDQEIAVEAMKSGLDDYIIKSPKHYVRLRGAVRSALNRAETQQRADRLEMRLQALLNRLNVGVFRTTVDGHILEGNAAFLRLLGVRSLQDVQASNWQELFSPPDEVLQTLNQEREVQLPRADGSYIWVSLSQTLSTTEAEPVVEGLIEDITVHKQAEQECDRLLMSERAARTEAQEANRIKDEFLAIVSHELRTPLNSILGWSQMLSNRKMNEVALAKALETIQRNAKLQGKLIDDILDISRIVQGKIQLDTRPVHLLTVINAAIENIRPTAEIKGTQVEPLLDPEVGQIMGDPVRLQQIVWNLLSNAVKFTPSSGRIEVRLESVDSMAQITVEDTGKGISADFLPYIFERFRQAEAATTRVYGGLGLGLAIVRYLVEMHSGTVYAASEGEGMGATFTVQLPLMESQNKLPLDERPLVLDNLPSLDGLRVLVVDDQTDTLELIAFILSEYGADVRTAASASEAFDAIAQSVPDILISDIGMPEEDGYSLLARVRTLPAEQGGLVPAIALTAFAREEERTFALKAGFSRHVPKPVEPAELVIVVANLAGRI